MSPPARRRRDDDYDGLALGWMLKVGAVLGAGLLGILGWLAQDSVSHRDADLASALACCRSCIEGIGELREDVAGLRADIRATMSATGSLARSLEGVSAHWQTERRERLAASPATPPGG